MKIYCSTCDKVQPVQIDDCRDAQTNEPFQDIVCKECYLVIASGTDIQRPWVGLTLEDKNEFLAQDFGGNRLDAMDWAARRLKEKNQ